MSRLLSIARVVLVALGLVLASAVLLYFWTRISESRGSIDALSYYVAGRLIAAGQGASLYDLTQQHNLAVEIAGGPTGSMNWPFVYPPWIALICAPLANLPFEAAFSSFVALQVVALGGALWQLSRLLPADQRHLGVLAVLVSASAVTVLAQPQWSAWALWGLAGALAATRKGQRERAGLWMVLGLVKPSLLLPGLLWLVLRRQWRALAILVGAGVILSVAVIPWVGAWWTPWLHALTSQDANVADSSAMPTLRGLLTLLNLDPGFVGSIGLGGVLLLVALVVAPASARPNVGLLCGWLMLPHAYVHDLLLLAILAATAAKRSRLYLGVGSALTWTSILLPAAWLAMPLLAMLGWFSLRRDDKAHGNVNAQ